MDIINYDEELPIELFYYQRTHSKIPSEFPPKDIYPLYYDAKSISITLNEGDMLFIPCGWFHFVFSENVNPDTKLNISITNVLKYYSCECFLYDKNKSYKSICEEIDYKTLLNQNGNDDIIEDIYFKNSELSIPFKISNYFPIKHSTIFTIDNLTSMIYEPLPIHISKDNYFISEHNTYFDKSRTQIKNMYFKDFLNYYKNKHVNDTSHCYLTLHDISSWDIPIPKCIKNIGMNEKRIWINFGNVYTNLHYDVLDNIIIQVHGSKRILLYPPSERSKLYMYNPYPPKFLCSISQKLNKGTT